MALGLASLTFEASSAFAQTFWTNGHGTGRYGDNLNWSPQVVPGSTTDVVIGIDGTIILIGAGNAASTVTVNNSSTVSLNMGLGDELNIAGKWGAGPLKALEVTDDSSLSLSGGAINIQQGASVVGSSSGDGTLQISGGMLDFDRIVPASPASQYATLAVGSNGASGTVNQSAGTVKTGAALTIGQDTGSGNYNLSGGLLTTGDKWGGSFGNLFHIYIGRNQLAGELATDTSGTLKITGNAQFVVGTLGALTVGDATGTGTQGGNGKIVQNSVGSTVSFNGYESFGAFTGGVGTYNLQKGNLSLVQGTVSFGTAAGATGTFHQTGGIVTAGTSNGGVGGAATAVQLIIGDAGVGTYALDSGTAVFTNGSGVVVGNQAGSTGRVDQIEGTLFINAGGQLNLKQSNSIYNLNGGTLEIGGRQSDLNGVDGIVGAGTLRLGGGTLKVVVNDLAVGVSSPSLTAGTYSFVNTNGFSASFSAPVTGAAGGLVKSGLGTLHFDSGADLIASLLITGGTIASTPGDSLSSYEVAVGTGAGNTGAYTMSGGALILLPGTPPPLVGGSASSLRVGDFGGTGTFTQTGGTVSVDGSLNVGNQGGTGVYNLSGGSLTLANGLFSLGRTAGSNPASSGTFNLSGTGLVDLVGTNFIVGDRDAGGAQGSGLLTQSGGIFRVESGAVLHLGGSGSSAYFLNGGTLEVGGNGLLPNYGGGPNGQFVLGGGTIKVTGSDLTTSASPTLTAGTTSIIDTNNYNAVLSGAISGSSGHLTKIGEGSLTLNGNLSFESLTTADGVTNLASALGTGLSTLNANATTNISVSQTLAALNIGDGAVVTLAQAGAANAAAANSSFAAVPVPGAWSLLMIGALRFLSLRRRKSHES